MKHLSICIPTYNNPLGLKKAVDSVLIQTFKNFEIIITDDSEISEDYTKIIDGILILDSRIKYIKNERPLGAPLNWNKSMEFAKGDVIILLHHDDWFVDEYSLEKLIMNFKGGILCANSIDVDLMTNAFVQINDKKNKYLPKLNLSSSYIFKRNFVGAPSAVIFSSDEIIFDVNLKWYVDSDFYYQKINRYGSIQYADFSSVNIGRSDSQITNSCESNLDLIIKELTYLRSKYRYNFVAFLIISFELAKKRVEFENQLLDHLSIDKFWDKLTFELFKIYRGKNRFAKSFIFSFGVLIAVISYLNFYLKK